MKSTTVNIVQAVRIEYEDENSLKAAIKDLQTSSNYGRVSSGNWMWAKVGQPIVTDLKTPL